MSTENAEYATASQGDVRRFGAARKIDIVICIVAMIGGLLIFWLGAELFGSAMSGPGDFRAPVGALIGYGGFVVCVVPCIALIGLIGSARAKTTIARAIFHGLQILMLLVVLRAGYEVLGVYSAYSDYQEIEQAEKDALYQSALDGDSQAQVRWGDKRYKIWQYGVGDVAEEACFAALHWYQQAAYQGSVDGQKSVGSAYDHCVPALPRNKARLIYLWYRVADENPRPHNNIQFDIDQFFRYRVENSLKMTAEDIAEVEPMVAKVMEIYADTELSLADRQTAIESTLRPWLTELESLYYVYDEQVYGYKKAP